MSLATLNSPILVSSMGAASLAAIPVLEQAIIGGSIPWNAVKLVNALAYALNLFATTRPGRVDGVDSEEDKDANERRKWTMLDPAGWAFSIWAPIFLGELLFAVAQLLLEETSAVVPVIKSASAPFVSAQIFHALWAASFRPKYTGNLRYISAAMLSGIALSLSKAHKVTSALNGQFVIYFLPISLHFGWTTAASLVNWNGALVIQDYVSPKLLAWVGHLSIVAATGVGVGLSIVRSAPVFGGVIAWALTALADGMGKRLEKAKSIKDKKRLGVLGAKTQYWLCVVGALATGATSAFLSVANILSKGK